MATSNLNCQQLVIKYPFQIIMCRPLPCKQTHSILINQGIMNSPVKLKDICSAMLVDIRQFDFGI